jgi:hypothetical protein
MSYLDTIPTKPKARPIPADAAKAQCLYIDAVAAYLRGTGFFTDMQVTFLIGLTAGSIACHYEIGTPAEMAGDIVLENHGKDKILDYLA